jgi:hypothetical protein
MDMEGTKQLARSTSIHAPVEVVYRLFVDNKALPDWAPVVDAVLSEDGGDESGVGCTRTCAVTMDGRSGTLVERCVEAVPNVRASFVVVDDSFGFGKLLRDYGFTAHFAGRGPNETAVRLETFYTPVNQLAALLNRLMMRRRFRAVVDALLGGLRTTAEQHDDVAASSATCSPSSAWVSSGAGKRRERGPWRSRARPGPVPRANRPEG